MTAIRASLPWPARRARWATGPLALAVMCAGACGDGEPAAVAGGTTDEATTASTGAGSSAGASTTTGTGGGTSGSGASATTAATAAASTATGGSSTAVTTDTATVTATTTDATTAGTGTATDTDTDGSTTGDPAEPGKFRVLILADTHIIGPQYDGNEDNIYMTEANARAVAQIVNAIEPQPDFGVVLGDVFHDGYHDTSFDYYLNNETAVSIAAEVLQTFRTTIYPLWGNHDYKFSAEYPPEFSHMLFREFFDRDPYYAIDYKGWKFILANGNIGSQGSGSYGREQLAWIDAQLAEGKPTLLFTHYMLMTVPELVTVRDEDPEGPIKDLYELVDRYKVDNLKGVWVGHTHNFWDVTTITGVGAGAPPEFKHYVLGATRFGTNNFWIVEFDGVAGTYEILDIAKAPPGIFPKQQGTECDYTQPPPYPCG